MRVAVVRIVAWRVAMARMRFVSGEEFSPVTIRNGYITCSSVSFPHSVCSVSVSWVSLLRPLLTAQLWCREVLRLVARLVQ